MALTKISTGMLKQDAASSDLNIDAGTLYLDVSNNRVGVNNTSPDTTFEVSSSTAPTLRISNGGGTSPNPKLEFFRQTGVTATFEYDVANKNIFIKNEFAGTTQFHIGGSERMRIDSSGNLLVGTTAATAYNNSSDVYGFNVYANGQIASSVNAAQAAYFNRQNSDGAIVDLRKDGASIGTIQTNSGRLDIQGASNTVRIQSGTSLMQVTNGTQITFETAGTERMRIADNGKVGIGTNIPDGTLHVHSGSAGTITAAASANNLVVENNGPVGLSLLFDDAANNAYGNIYWGNETDGSADGRITYFGSTYVTPADRQSMEFRTAGTARMRIDSSGNVGIGTDSPDGKLDVAGNVYLANYSGTGENQTILAQNNYGQMRAGIRSGVPYIGSITSLDFALYTGNSEKVRIDTSGNVGIGTTNPGSKLQIQTSHTETDVTAANSNSTLNVANSGAGNGIYNAIKFAANQQDMYIMSFNNNQQADRRLGFFLGSVAGDAATDERLSIRGNGKVGIGTISPATQLHVSDSATNAYSSTITKGSNHSGLTLVQNDGMTGVFFATGGSGTGSHWSAITGSRSNGSNWATQLNFYTHPSNTSNLTDANQRMIITGDGNVGIGTTSPNSLLQLETAATSAAGGLTLTNTNASGYSTVQFKNTGGTAQTYTLALGGSSSAFAQQLYIYDDTDSAARVVLDHTGNVGIGTSSPATKFHVSAGNTNANIIARLEQGTTPGNYSAVEVGRTGGNGTAEMTAAVSGGVPIAGIPGIMLGSSNSSLPAVAIQTPNSSSGHIVFNPKGSEKVRISADGNVGIGESSPQGKLHLKKTDTGNSPQNPAGNQLVIENGDSSGSSDIQFLSAINGYSHIFFGDAADANVGVLLYDHTNNSMQFTTNTAERMRIDSAGRVVVQDDVTYTANAPTTRGSLILAGASGSTSAGGLEFHTSSGGGAGYGTRIASSDANMFFLRRSNASGWTESMRIETDIIKLSPSGNERVRINNSNSTSNLSVGLHGVSGINASAAVHGGTGDAALVVSNTNLADSSSAYGWTGRGGRYLTSNGTNWTNDGKDAGLVIGSSDSSTQRRNLGIVLHNENQSNNTFSPGLFFGNQSNSGQYNTGYAYIMGRKVGQGVDTNWSTGEIHMDTAGPRTGTATRNAYMDNIPAFKIDANGDVNMPYKAYAYGKITNNPSSPTNNYGFPLTTTRYQNCTPQTTGHGPGITITKAGFYVLYMSFLYDPAGNYIYSGWCVNGSQIHHWHSNHAISSNHDAVSSIGVYLNIGDHVTIENSSQSITTIYGNSHSTWYICKIG